MTTTTLRTLWHVCDPEQHSRNCLNEVAVSYDRPDMTVVGQMVIEFHAPIRELETLGEGPEIKVAATRTAKWPQVTSYR